MNAVMDEAGWCESNSSRNWYINELASFGEQTVGGREVYAVNIPYATL